MQRNIGEKLQLAQSLNLLKEVMGVKSIDYSADFDNILKNLTNLKYYMMKG